MKTLELLKHRIEAIPLAVTWSLGELAEARGKQELFTKQSPQKLKILREHAMVESAISSNRIEGVTIDQARGAKTELVMSAISRQQAAFRLADIEQLCPGVGRDWIQTLMVQLRETGVLHCEGRGPAARWTYQAPTTTKDSSGGSTS